MCPPVKLRHGHCLEASAGEYPMLMFLGTCNTLFGAIPTLIHRILHSGWRQRLFRHSHANPALVLFALRLQILQEIRKRTFETRSDSFEFTVPSIDTVWRSPGS